MRTNNGSTVTQDRAPKATTTPKATRKGAAAEAGFAPVKGDTTKLGDYTYTGSAADAILGGKVWAHWRGTHAALGVPENTALGTGTRGSILAVCAWGYAQTTQRHEAMYLFKCTMLYRQGLAKAAKLDTSKYDPSVGGVGFVGFETGAKSHLGALVNVVRVRPHAATGLMVLTTLQGGKAYPGHASLVTPKLHKPITPKPALSKRETQAAKAIDSAVHNANAQVQRTVERAQAQVDRVVDAQLPTPVAPTA